MSESANNIELRSEKVRNIIGQIPPRIIRSGITIVFLIIAGIIIGTYFFEYEYTVETIATIEQKNETSFIIIEIPANEMNKIKKGHKVILTFVNTQNLHNKQVEAKIQEIPNKIQIKNNKGYFNVKIKMTEQLKTSDNETINLYETTNVKAEIITEKISFFDRIIKPFKDILNARD